MGGALLTTAAAVAALSVSAALLGPAAPASAIAKDGTASSGAIADELGSLIRALPGRYTVSVRELDGAQRTFGVGAGARREPASTAKLFIAYGVLREIDRGRLEPTSTVASGLTVRACLRAMIEPSDNPCATELRQKIGTRHLDRVLRAEGYRDTRFWYSDGRTKVTSAADLSRLLVRLERGALLSPTSTRRLLRLLETQVWREAIPTGIPRGVRQASKPGTLSTARGMVQTDAAIVYGAKSRYSIAVMGDRGATIGSITRISRLVYQRLQGTFGTPFDYSRSQMVTIERTPLRAGPGGRIVNSIAAGRRVEVIDSRRQWYLVRVGHSRGWMNNQALTLRQP